MPSTHYWIKVFQRFIMSNDLASSLAVVPGLTWFPGAHPEPATRHIDYVLYDGAGTVFLCCLLFHSRFHWLNPGQKTHEKVEELASDAAELAAGWREPQGPLKPESVLRGLRVEVVGLMPALHGSTGTDYVKGVTEACRTHRVSLFSADLSALHVVAPRPARHRPPTVPSALHSGVRLAMSMAKLASIDSLHFHRRNTTLRRDVGLLRARPGLSALNSLRWCL